MKLYRPFGNVTHWLTQTTHGESAETPADWSKQKAEDWSAVKGTAVYAGVDGKIVNVTTAAGRYLTLDPGSACPFWILYVHCDPVSGIKIGSTVKRGQKIAVTAGSYGHLHLGMKNKSRKPPHPEPIAYLDRKTDVRTKYAGIAKIWFKDGKFNWDLFADRHVMDPPVDPLQVCQSLVDKLQEQVTKLESTVKRRDATIAGLRKEIELLRQDITAHETANKRLADQLATEKDRFAKLQTKHQECMTNLASCRASCNTAGCTIKELIHAIVSRMFGSNIS